MSTIPEEEKHVSTAVQDITGTTSAEEKANWAKKVSERKLFETGGLPETTTFVVGLPYCITTNIDVADGLSNGMVGHLAHIEYDEERIKRVWLRFSDIQRVGVRRKLKWASYAEKNGIPRNAVPIDLRKAHIALDKSQKIHLDRQHFPLEFMCLNNS